MSNKELIAMIGKNPRLLKDVEHQTPEMCLAAVRTNGISLIFVKRQTPEICIEAVKTTASAMRYVRDQTPDVILACGVANPESLVFVRKEISESLKLDILERNGLALEYMPEQPPREHPGTPEALRQF